MAAYWLDAVFPVVVPFRMHHLSAVTPLAWLWTTGLALMAIAS